MINNETTSYVSEKLRRLLKCYVAGMLVRNQCVSQRSHNQPSNPRLSWFCPKLPTNIGLITKLHVASPYVTSKTYKLNASKLITSGVQGTKITLPTYTINL